MSLLATLLAVTLATTITLTPIVVMLIVGTAIPILVGLLSKAKAPAGVKQALTVVLVGAATLIVQSTLGDGSAVFSLETLLLAAAGWATTIATYHEVYKRIDLNESLIPDRGLGRVIDTTGQRRPPGPLSGPHGFDRPAGT